MSSTSCPISMWCRAKARKTPRCRERSFPWFSRFSFSFPPPFLLSFLPASLLPFFESSVHLIRIKGRDYKIRSRPSLPGGLCRSTVWSQASCSTVIPPGNSSREQHLLPGPLRPCMSSGLVSAGPRLALQASQSCCCSAPG